MDLRSLNVGDIILGVDSYQHKYHTKYRVAEYIIQEILIRKKDTGEKISYNTLPVKASNRWHHTVDEEDFLRGEYYLISDRAKAEISAQEKQYEEDKKFIDKSKERLTVIKELIQLREREIKEYQQEKKVLEEEIVKSIVAQPNLISKP